MRSQLSSARSCNDQLSSTLQTERQVALCRSRDLAARLRDAEDGLMDKVRELTAARDAQTGLKAEIASLRALIESAELRYTPYYERDVQGAPRKCGHRLRTTILAADRIWNSLPQTVLSSDSVAVFKLRLKIFLFSQVFSSFSAH